MWEEDWGISVFFKVSEVNNRNKIHVIVKLILDFFIDFFFLKIDIGNWCGGNLCHTQEVAEVVKSLIKLYQKFLDFDFFFFSIFQKSRIWEIEFLYFLKIQLQKILIFEK